jgi:hypothetical protein
MHIYVLRLRDGNCIVTYAENASEAVKRASPLAGSEVATIRELESFTAQFVLSEEGELNSVLLHGETVSDLLGHEYPMLNAARSQAYREFGTSETDRKTEHVLFDQRAQSHAKGWDARDKSLVKYAVEQERLRLAN